MKKIEEENKIVYLNNQNKINVTITRVWPMVNIDTCDYNLIEFALNNIEKDLEIGVNGILCMISIEDTKIDELLRRYNYKELFTTYSIEYNSNFNNIDLSSFIISDQITSEVNDYFTYKLKEKTDEEIPYQKIKPGFFQYYSFYDDNHKIVGIVCYYIENNILFIREVLSDSKDVMKHMIEFVLNKHKIEARIDCLTIESRLNETIKLLHGKFILKNYRKFND